MYWLEYGMSVGINVCLRGLYNFMFVNNYFVGDGKFYVYMGFVYYVFLENRWIKFYEYCFIFWEIR